MAKIVIIADGTVLLEGKVGDVNGLVAAVFPLLDAPRLRLVESARSAAPAALPEQRAAKPTGGVRAVVRRARPSTDREFVALVAVYRHVVYGRPTRSTDVDRYARNVRRPMSNPSMAVKQAYRENDLEQIRQGKPSHYVPTERAIRRWAAFISDAENTSEE